MIEVLGIDQEGTRLTLELGNKPGALLQALQVIKSYEANVLSIVTCEKCRRVENRGVVVLRIDHYDWRPIVKDIKDKGIKVLDART